MTTSRVVGVVAGRCGEVWTRLAGSSYLSAVGQTYQSATHTRPQHTDMELSYSSTSSNCSSISRYDYEKPTEVFWKQYKRGTRSLSLWRLLKLLFSKQEKRKTVMANRNDSLHRFYEELYRLEHSRLQSTLIREGNSDILDNSISQYYQQEEEEEEENIYYLPFC